MEAIEHAFVAMRKRPACDQAAYLKYQETVERPKRRHTPKKKAAKNKSTKDRTIPSRNHRLRLSASDRRAFSKSLSPASNARKAFVEALELKPGSFRKIVGSPLKSQDYDE